MPTNTTAYSLGDAVRLSVVVKTTAGTPVNTGVTLWVNSPSTKVKYGPITSTASTVLDNYATGSWRKTISLTRAGRWTWEWQSTGTVQVTTGGALAVHPAYATT